MAVQQRAATAPTARSVPPSVRPDTVAAAVSVRLRVPVLAAVATLLALAAHAVADGTAPAPRLLALAGVLVALTAAAALRRERSAAALAGLLVLTQAVAHAVLCLCHCSPASTVGTVVHTWLCPPVLSAEQARWAADPLLLSAPGTGHGVHDAGYLAHLSPGVLMLALHLLAAVVLACWLARGERAVWAALRTVWPVLAALLAGPHPVAVLRPVRPGRAVLSAVRTLREQRTTALVAPRRGPPLGAFA